MDNTFTNKIYGKCMDINSLMVVIIFHNSTCMKKIFSDRFCGMDADFLKMQNKFPNFTKYGKC